MEVFTHATSRSGPSGDMASHETVGLELFCLNQASMADDGNTALPVGGATGGAGGGGATDSLSSLTVELLEAHQSQVSEIAKKQDLLEAMKRRTREGVVEFLHTLYKEVKKKKASVSLLEINRDLSHNSYRLSLQAMEQDKLRQEITEQLKHNHKLQQKLDQTERQYKSENQQLVEYQQKMRKYKEQVAECEKQGHLQCQIQHLQLEIQETRQRKSALESSVNDSVKLMNGELIMELQSHADTLQASKAEQTERIEKKQVAVEEAKERLNKLKRETEMLKRRNQAQMTRLRRQLQEAQARNKQWANEATRLQHSIEQLQNSL